MHPLKEKKNVMELLDSCEAYVAYIPPYSTELAPVEKYFEVLKYLISKDKIITAI